MIEGEIILMNIDNLFFGSGYENHAKGQLTKMGYEAFKMEADFGFDLLVTNNAKKNFKGKINKDYCVFQVKAGVVYNWENYEQASSTRRKGIAEFYFSNEHLYNLLNEKNAFLLCYIVDPMECDSIIGHFWLNNSHLKYLMDQKNPKYSSKWLWFNQTKKDYLTLRIKIVLEENIEEQYKKILINFKDLLENKLDLNSFQQQQLSKIHTSLLNIINKSAIINQNQNSKIELCASTKKSGEFGSSLSIKNELLDLHNFTNNKYINSPFTYYRGPQYEI